MNDVRRVDPARSRIVLVGVESYTDAVIPDEPAIANNVADLTEVLTDPAFGAFDSEHLLVAPDGAGVQDVGSLLLTAAAEAEDLLLFYYAGHGFPTTSRAELHLSLAGTGIDRLAFTALPFDAVRDVFLQARARSRVVILDCCYSGKAIGRILGDADVPEPLDIAGTYTLTASPATRPASAALPGERHTAFTGRLIELLRTGNPEAGPDLSLGDIYRHLRIRLRADGLPEPQQRGTATGDRLALTPNPAYVKGRAVPVRSPTYKRVVRRNVQPAPVPKDLRAALENRYPKIRAAAVEVLAEWLDDADPRLVRAAREELLKIVEFDRPEVADVARVALSRQRVSGAVLAVPVPAADRAGTAELPERRILPVPDRTMDTAELLARQIAAAPSRAETLAAVAKAVAAIDRPRAARLVDEAAMTARKIKDDLTQVELLVMIAEAASACDPARASELVGEAQAIARAILDESSKGWALAAIAEAVAKNEPNRSVGIARGVADAPAKISALVKVASVIAVNDPDRASRLLGEAEAIALESIEESAHVQALTTVATAMAARDPERASILIDTAETVANAIADPAAKASALAEIAQAAAASDPDHAEAIAYAITDPRPQAWALTMIVEAVAASDPLRAGALAHGISDAPLKARALAKSAEALTASDPNEAESLAYTIADESWKARALAMVAEAAFLGDADRAARLIGDAERLGHGITDSSSKAWALTEITMVRLRLCS
ncbi:caspase family protein [Catenulispora rubra]|uniref:caspase family protein n=1 Tax=Catenulispora rubra TaxID=280293 RepID=UPI0018923B15|nr:caspase family protein [Catenulispora rubra]